MPLWQIFYPAGFYTPAEKTAFSQAITDLYNIKSEAKLPDFYVNVLFVPYETSPTGDASSSGSDKPSFFIAGKPRGNFVRIVIEQIARNFNPDDTERMHTWTSWVEDTIAPYVKDKPSRDGFEREVDWEVHIAETSRELWRINGYIPPMPNSKGEIAWRKAGKAVPI